MSFGTINDSNIQSPPRPFCSSQPRPFEVRDQRQQALPNINMYPNPRMTAPIDLEKWGIKFDGSRKSFTGEDFVFRVESLQVDYNCPMSTLMKGFHHLLTGSAYEWFWTFRRKNPFCEWTHLKHHLIRKFRRFESDSEIQRCIMKRRQHPSESSEAFIGEIIALKNQLSRGVREDELVRIVKDNLKDGIYQLIYPIPINTFDHLLEECRRAERNLSKRNNHRQYNTRRVNELEFNEVPTNCEHNIEAMRMNLPPARQLICWNCKTLGHSFVECDSEQRNLFYYKYGFENVITPKCLKCSGNK
ncbi:hypothetical protein CVS40_8859 [Lucilia cuprina]|nr:hypothetical protein CVS40_8859 [Lucilia cuprina]